MRFEKIVKKYSTDTIDCEQRFFDFNVATFNYLLGKIQNLILNYRFRT
jgi:hypothetical protein